MRISDWSSDVCSSDLQRLITTVDDSADAVPLALERARLADKLNLSTEEVLLDFRRALAREPGCRLALFRPESPERGNGFSPAHGRATCREKGCPNVSIAGVADILKKQKRKPTT